MEKYITLAVILFLLHLPYSGTAQNLPMHMMFNADSSRLSTGNVAAEGLYDDSRVMDIHLYFYETDFWEQMLANYNTSRYVPARLVYENSSYDSVAVQFKGQTSFTKALQSGSEKLSFSIKINEIIEGQDIDGYNNINLNNAFEDFSFMKEVLYGRLSRELVPALKGNYVNLYLDDEYWGVYTNIQQLNGDFLKEWFPENDGIRWRADVPPVTTNLKSVVELQGSLWGDGTAALNYLGEDTAAYQQYYTLKDTDLDHSWEYLVRLCDVLNNTPVDDVADSLDKIMDIDATLWYLAQEIVFSDDDSYVYKGKMDYYLFWEEATGRMIPLEFDGNSAMNLRNREWPPFMNELNENYPLLNILLSVPELRQRYIAHVKTLVNTAFDRATAFDLIDGYAALINPLLENDPKIDFTMEEHLLDINRLRNFIDFRKKFILSFPEFDGIAPLIESVESSVPTNGNKIPEHMEELLVTARVSHPEGIQAVHLYYGTGIRGEYEMLEMNDGGFAGDSLSGDGIYSMNIPGHAAGTFIRYYIEATANDSVHTVSFFPERAAYDVMVFQVKLSLADQAGIVINELLASNSATNVDEYGDSGDWIELFNASDQEISLGGYYLSDEAADLFRWSLSDTTLVPGAYLALWADGDL